MSEPITSYLWRLVISLLIGGVVGLEREFKGKPAGIRTNILMCLGSCLIMIISIEVARMAGGSADPGRIAAQVVTGVGFLCAGTIMRSKFSISGLTTAATIWVLSALGLAIGAGYIMLSVYVAALITITLVIIRNVESALHRLHSDHIVQISAERREGIVPMILREFTGLKIPTEVHEVSLAGDTWNITIEYDTSKRKHTQLLKELSDLDGIRSVTEMRQPY
jgi:putative Mg2+ transporter-C (MgtC) family protein